MGGRPWKAQPWGAGRPGSGVQHGGGTALVGGGRPREEQALSPVAAQERAEPGSAAPEAAVRGPASPAPEPRRQSAAFSWERPRAPGCGPRVSGPGDCHALTGALGGVPFPHSRPRFLPGIRARPAPPLPHRPRSGFGAAAGRPEEKAGRRLPAFRGAGQSAEGPGWWRAGRWRSAGPSPAVPSGVPHPPRRLWVPASPGSWGGTRGGHLPGGPFRRRRGEPPRWRPAGGCGGRPPRQRLLRTAAPRLVPPRVAASPFRPLSRPP